MSRRHRIVHFVFVMGLALSVMALSGDSRTKSVDAVVLTAPTHVTWVASPWATLALREDPLCGCGDSDWFFVLYVSGELRNDGAATLEVNGPAEVRLDGVAYGGAVTVQLRTYGARETSNREIPPGETRYLNVDIEDLPNSTFDSLDLLEITLPTSDGTPIQLRFDGFLQAEER